MHALVATAAIAAVLLSASDAEARARVKFGSTGAKAAPKAAAATPTGTSGGVMVPAVLLGGGIAARAARSRDDLPTGSMNPVSPVPSGSVSTVTPTTAKPAFVCGSDRSVGAGIGFCQVN